MLLALPLLCSIAAADADADADVVETDDDGLGVEAWAFASEGYRLRMAQEGGADHDARLLLDSGARAFDGRLGADVSGALFWDVDGVSGDSDDFASVHDAQGPVDVLVDTLELRASDASWLRRASIGRLTVEEGAPLTLDGAAVALAPFATSDVAWIVFGSAGRTVHFFAAANDIPEWWTGGVGTEIVALDGAGAGATKAQIDWRALVEDSAKQRFAQSYGAAFFRKFDDALLVQLHGRGLDDELSYVGGRAHAAWTPWRVGVDVDVLQQFATLGEVFEDAALGGNPYFAILGESRPFVRGNVDAFGRRYLAFFDGGVHAGASGRKVIDGAPGPFNRDIARLYLSADAADVVVAGPFVSAIVSYDFAVDEGQDGVFALGGSAGYAGEIVRAALGTSWDRAKYTYYRDVAELTDVRTVFASLEVRPWRALRFRGDYSLEIADRVVHTAQVSLIQEIGGAW